jgi:arginyl-tRNA synthetase
MKNNEKLKKLLSEKPIKGSQKQIEEWRRKAKALRAKSEKEHQKWVRKTEEQWLDKKEWFKMYDKLMELSLEQLRDLTTKLGITFTGGNDKIKNKEEFVLVLDEADKDELLKEYKKKTPS